MTPPPLANANGCIWTDDLAVPTAWAPVGEIANEFPLLGRTSHCLFRLLSIDRMISGNVEQFIQIEVTEWAEIHTEPTTLASL